MPVTMFVTDRFGELALALAGEEDRIAKDVAQTLFDKAVDTCPVDTGAMQSAHRMEKLGEGKYEVTVQKDEELAGDKTYANFVNAGTVKMSAQPWFSDACQVAQRKLEQSRIFEGVL